MGQESKGLGWAGMKCRRARGGSRGKIRRDLNQAWGRRGEHALICSVGMIVVGAMLCRAGVQKQAVHNGATGQEQEGQRQVTEMS